MDFHMNNYQRLLVVIDEHDFSLKGVARALYIASRSNAVVVVMLLEHGSFINRLVDTFEHDELETAALTQPLSLEKKRQCIQQFIKSTSQSGLRISQSAITCSCCDDILRFCDDLKVDAIFTAASRHKLWNWLTIKALDIRLIRESLKPIIIVKDHPWEPGGRIISLIESCTEDTDKKALNEKVLESTAHFVHLLQGCCHLVDCYFDDHLSLNDDRRNKFALDEHHHFQLLSDYSHRYHLLPSNTLASHQHFHLAKSLPEAEIEILSKQVDSELVILGEQGGFDLLNHFYGNVAEQVVERINCDLLVVKPSSQIGH